MEIQLKFRQGADLHQISNRIKRESNRDLARELPSRFLSNDVEGEMTMHFDEVVRIDLWFFSTCMLLPVMLRHQKS